MGTHKTLQNIAIVLTFGWLAACGNHYTVEYMDGEDGSLEQAVSLGEELFVGDNFIESTKPYCSNLSFSGVTWNKSLTGYERRSLAIALSLSGSFEGTQGWKNLTNNFDGMGLSAGLLNQTLGTGSLQPLLANLQLRSPAAFQYVASSRRTSLLAMVASWKSSKGYTVPSALSKLMHDSDVDVTSSKLDIPETDDGFGLSGKIEVSGTAENSSVSWATANLYQSSGSFKPEWKTELANLMGHPAYVSEQISASEVLHHRAAGYVSRLGFSSLRSYLFMFDICVQNGGLNDSEFAELEADIKREGLKTETTILKRLLEIRLRRVLSQWRNDVRSRKTAIIDGTGTVHGSARNFPKQYCFSQVDPIK